MLEVFRNDPDSGTSNDTNEQFSSHRRDVPVSGSDSGATHSSAVPPSDPDTSSTIPSNTDSNATLESLVTPGRDTDNHAGPKRAYAMRDLVPAISHLVEWVRYVAAAKPPAASDSSILDLTRIETEAAQNYLRAAWNEAGSTSPMFTMYALDSTVRLGSIGLPLVYRILDRYNDAIEELNPAQRCKAVCALARGRVPHHAFFEAVVQDAILYPHQYDLTQLNRILGASTEVNLAAPKLATIVLEQAQHIHENVQMAANVGPLLLRVARNLEIAGHDAGSRLLDAALQRLEASSRKDGVTSGLAARVAQLCRVNGRPCPAWALSKVPIFAVGENLALRPFQVEIRQELLKGGIAHEVGVLCAGISMDYFLPPQAGLKKGVALQADVTRARYVSSAKDGSSALVASERYLERLRRSFGIETIRIRSDEWLDAKYKGMHSALLEHQIFGGSAQGER